MLRESNQPVKLKYIKLKSSLLKLSYIGYIVTFLCKFQNIHIALITFPIR